MAVIIKNLASGTLTNTTTKTLNPTAGKSWLIKNIVLTNKDTLNRTVDVKVTGTTPSTAAYMAPPGMSIPASSSVVLDAEVTLQYPTTGTSETLSITVGSTPTTGVDYLLNGLERDL